ncbi:MAG: RNA methyltransferase [Dissulfurimicrobium sp.]|uniref:RNA methyltransferase n=1 Tax=Dissulfurimicrobium sp. TaxID=2022436 RepID=UPI0040496EAA
MENIGVVLNEPKYPENIGAVARCCKNMGVRHLILVRPRDLNTEKMLKMATHKAADLIENMAIFDDLEKAISPFNYAVGTTARTGRQRRPTGTPKDMAPFIATLSQTNRIAIVFGSENFGLSNKELHLCQAVVNIPTADFSSINLAQSVMILCYELFTAETTETGFKPRLASIMELEGMYRHLSEVFLSIGLVNPNNPDYWIENAKKFLGRLELRSKEVKIIRGICRQILWACNRQKD